VKAKRIDHIGIVVKDIDAAIATYTRNFGFRTGGSGVGTVPEFGIKYATMPVGDSGLEFIQPTRDDSPASIHLASRGEGTFTLSIEVDDLDGAIAHLRGLGASVSDANRGVAHVSAESTHGVNLQLMQREGR
jgi:methylmalonyl-CoA/ethylmalonyl-CoA epimerase